MNKGTDTMTLAIIAFVAGWIAQWLLSWARRRVREWGIEADEWLQGPEF